MKFFSKGFIFRWGVRIKDFGERLGHIKVNGVFILSGIADRVIHKGLEVKNSVSNFPVAEF